MERRESIRHPQNFPPRVNIIFCTYPQTDRVSRIFQVSQDLFDSFDSFHLFRNFQFSCDSLPRNPSFLPPVEDKKWRWLINGSAREEPSSGFQLRDVKTRLSPSSSLLSGEGEPVSLLSRLPLHSWPRISRRRTENPPLPLPIVGLFCPVSPGRAMRYLWVSFGGLCRSRHYTGRQPSPLALGPSSPLVPYLAMGIQFSRSPSPPCRRNFSRNFALPFFIPLSR